VSAERSAGAEISLELAEKQNRTVISVKNDWATVFTERT
jgi:hypothetical protein